MRYALLVVALALSAAALGTIELDAPWQLAVVCTGAFLVFTPGLLVVHFLALPDRLLALVVGLLVGPSLWVLIGALQLFTGLWAPRTTVLWGACLLGGLALLLIARGVPREPATAPGLGVPGREASVERYAVDEAD